MTHPKFTVVTPTFNQGEFIQKTIDSVLSQGYPNLEFIIIDGGSNDNTVEIIKKYERHLAYWVSEPDLGQSDAINKGFAHSTGSILTWLNSDDWYTRGALNCFAEACREHPDCHVWVGDGDMLDEVGTVFHHPKYAGEITLNSLYQWMSDYDFMQPSAAFSRTVWETCGPLDEGEHIALDVDFWLRIATKGFRFARIDNLLSHSLMHPAAKTTALREQMYIEAALVIARHGGHNFVKPILVEQIKRHLVCQEKLTWYEKNYAAVTSHPLVRMIRPLVKFAANDMSSVWAKVLPPWVKK
jgi:glycosyltransferase involved in cell wall biosynthesis